MDVLPFIRYTRHLEMAVSDANLHAKEGLVEPHTVRLVFGIGSIVGLFVLTGCAGTGDVVYLEIQAVPAAPHSAKQQGGQREEIKVAVEAFEDLRPEKSHLGFRTHLWGGVTRFNFMGGKAGDVIAQVVADHLKQKGWRVWVSSHGGPAPDGDPDVVLTGQIQDFSANAKSGAFFTKLTVKSKLTVLARNAVDASTTSMNLEGTSTDSVFWFEPKDVQELVNETLKESLEKLTADTKVEKRALRPR